MAFSSWGTYMVGGLVGCRDLSSVQGPIGDAVPIGDVGAICSWVAYRGCRALQGMWGPFLAIEGAIEDAEGPYSWGAYRGCGGLFQLPGGGVL